MDLIGLIRNGNVDKWNHALSKYKEDAITYRGKTGYEMMLLDLLKSYRKLYEGINNTDEQSIYKGLHHALIEACISDHRKSTSYRNEIRHLTILYKRIFKGLSHLRIADELYISPRRILLDLDLIYKLLYLTLQQNDNLIERGEELEKSFEFYINDKRVEIDKHFKHKIREGYMLRIIDKNNKILKDIPLIDKENGLEIILPYSKEVKEKNKEVMELVEEGDWLSLRDMFYDVDVPQYSRVLIYSMLSRAGMTDILYEKNKPRYIRLDSISSQIPPISEEIIREIDDKCDEIFEIKGIELSLGEIEVIKGEVTVLVNADKLSSMLNDILRKYVSNIAFQHKHKK